MQKAKENNQDGAKVIPLQHSVFRPVQILSNRDEMAMIGWQALNEIDGLLKDHFKEEKAAE